MADALASLASMWEGPAKMLVKPIILLKSEKTKHKFLGIVTIKAYNKT